MTLEEAVDKLAANDDIVRVLGEELDTELIEHNSSTKCPVALWLGSEIGEPVVVSSDWAVLRDTIGINGRVMLPENIKQVIADFDDKKLNEAFGL